MSELVIIPFFVAFVLIPILVALFRRAPSRGYYVPMDHSPTPKLQRDWDRAARDERMQALGEL